MTTDSITIHAPIAKGYEQILTAVVPGIHSFWRCLRESRWTSLGPRRQSTDKASYRDANRRSDVLISPGFAAI